MSGTDWSRHVGEKHGQRDRAAARDMQARADVEHQRDTACLERWPSIVGSIRSLVTNYNEGAGREAITVVAEAIDHRLTVESATNGRHGLVIALDGSDLSVRTRSGPDQPLSGTKWVNLSRTDDEAAEYLLRDWMERL